MPRLVNGSTIYCQCPGCGQDTLAAAVHGAHRCNVCSFDYTTLAGDRARRERWLLDNLRRGPMFQLAALHLHRHVMKLPPAQSDAEVVAFAARNGVKMPTGALLGPRAIAGVVVIVLAIAAVIAFVVMRK